MADKRRQELWCHDCGNYVQFTLDFDLDGRHLLNCPECGHEHYRIIRDGQITAERWGQDPRQGSMQTYSVTNCSASTTTMDTWATSGSSIISWTTMTATTA